MNLRKQKKTPLVNPDAGVKGKVVLGIGGFAALIAVIMVFKFIGIQTIEGNERAVVQHWSDGVRADLWQPGTTFYNGLTTTPYVYHVGAQRFIMGEGENADVPPFKVTTGGEGNEHPALVNIGINVENFVFDRIVLDHYYVQKIAARQLAHQDKLKNIEETKAAEEAAKKTEALAEADKLKRIVNAEAAKQEEIKKAEANNESRILAAKANAAEIKEKAAADRFRKEQDAKGLLAQGIAEAKVAEAKRNSKYNGVSGLRQAQVEIAQARVGLFQNMAIKGVLDKDVALTIINSTGSNTPTLTVPAGVSK